MKFFTLKIKPDEILVINQDAHEFEKKNGCFERLVFDDGTVILLKLVSVNKKKKIAIFRYRNETMGREGGTAATKKRLVVDFDDNLCFLVTEFQKDYVIIARAPDKYLEEKMDEKIQAQAKQTPAQPTQTQAQPSQTHPQQTQLNHLNP